MLSLFRPLSEAVVRGLWILHCASDQELEKFEKKKKLDKHFGELIQDVENKIGDDLKTLSKLKNNAWVAMNRGLIASVQIAALSSNENLINEHIDKMKEYVGTFRSVDLTL